MMDLVQATDLREPGADRLDGLATSLNTSSPDDDQNSLGPIINHTMHSPIPAMFPASAGNSGVRRCLHQHAEGQWAEKRILGKVGFCVSLRTAALPCMQHGAMSL